eukprot:scaffold14812_cov112-Isochrysis_galbana.AAC.2
MCLVSGACDGAECVWSGGELVCDEYVTSVDAGAVLLLFHPASCASSSPQCSCFCSLHHGPWLCCPRSSDFVHTHDTRTATLIQVSDVCPGCGTAGDIAFLPVRKRGGGDAERGRAYMFEMCVDSSRKRAGEPGPRERNAEREREKAGQSRSSRTREEK